MEMRTVIAGLGVLSALAACGGSTSSGGSSNASGPAGGGGGGSATAVKVCDLVTKDQVATAVGMPVTDGKPGDLGVQGCTWSAVSDTNTTTISMTFDPSSTSFDAGKQQAHLAGGTPIVPVSGLGQDAFYFGTGEGALLEVKTSKGVLSVDVILRSATATPQAEQQAKEALARLALQKL